MHSLPLYLYSRVTIHDTTVLTFTLIMVEPWLLTILCGWISSQCGLVSSLCGCGLWRGWRLCQCQLYLFANLTDSQLVDSTWVSKGKLEIRCYRGQFSENRLVQCIIVARACVRLCYGYQHHWYSLLYTYRRTYVNLLDFEWRHLKNPLQRA